MKRAARLIATLVRLRSGERGETLISVITSIAILAIAAASATSAIMGFTRGATDDKIIEETTLHTQSISNLVTAELRMTGAGMPFTQSNFLITSAGIGTASLPVLTTSTASSISFRLNTKGKTSVLTSSFDPASTTSFSVLSSSPFSQGDTIYLSDVTAGGTNGLQATVGSISGTTITISGPVYNAGATFAAGSIAQPVSTITYANSAGGITRTEGGLTTTLYPGSSITFQYLDSAGTSLALPLTAATIASSLYAVAAAVTVQSPNNLQSGSPHSATLTNRAALRNINLTR